MKVVLASASPRRSALLREIVPEFEVIASDVDETPLSGEEPATTARRLSLAKASAIFADRPEALVIGGDTVVALADGASFRQLAKPDSESDAIRMLTDLSGREHLVITGIAVLSPRRCDVAHETTRVRFRRLKPDEITRYVKTGEPMDKAGAYAIQGGAAGFVEGVSGSISNVVGLPLETLRTLIDGLI